MYSLCSQADAEKQLPEIYMTPCLCATILSHIPHAGYEICAGIL